MKHLRKEKRKIGVLVPAGNTILETDFHTMAPKDISINTARIGRGKNPTVSFFEHLKIQSDDLENAIQRISAAEVNVIVYGCTSGSFFGGMKWEKELIRRMEKEANGIEVLTTTGAVLLGLNEMGIKKVAVATPYLEEVNVKLRELLTNVGHTVVSIKGLGYRKETPLQPLEISYKLAKEVNRSEADGIFISCTELKAIENIQKLEKELGKPVITSNQASIWGALKKIGYKKPIRGYGKLLTKL